jgi:hypothetical protein
VIPAHAGDQELLLLPGKSDGLVWHSGLSGFPVLGLPYLAGGRCVCNGCLQRKSLHSQNFQQVLTIPGGRASAVEPMIHTTPPKVDKAGTSSMKVPIAQALVARPGSKASDDDLVDDDIDLLNFIAAEFETVCRTSPWL